MGWRRYAKPRYGMIAGFLLLVGVVVPAVFGLLTEKAMEIGTADLLDKSTNWDSSNIANSTYFVSEVVEFFDNQTGNIYSIDAVYDDSTDEDLVLLSTDTVKSTGDFPTDYTYVWVQMNKTALENVDKIVILLKVHDAASVELDKVNIKVQLQSYKWGSDYFFDIGTYNLTDAYNSTLRVEIAIDAIKRLKISSSDTNPVLLVMLRSSSTSNLVDLNNLVFGYKVELYDVKKVNASAISNTMLVTAGILSWIGAFAATPYWNPMKDPSHRDVRRVAGRVRRIRRRR